MSRNLVPVRTRAAALGAAFALSGCGGGNMSSLFHGAVSNGAPVAAAAGPVADDWTTFAHDQFRSGFQPQVTGISPASVASLAVRWKVATGEGITASPLVANGRVYIAGSTGTVRALDARTGSTVWTTALGGAIAMTPALADGLLFVGLHQQPGDFIALDAASGAIKWRATFPGAVRSEPVIANGTVFEGEASGDPKVCNHGGIRALNEQLGTPVWTTYIDPTTNDGGSVWAPLSYDKGQLYFGSGNSCSMGIGAANALLSLDAAGNKRWQKQAENSLSDDDFGGGTLLLNGTAIAENKDGDLFAMDEASGSAIWNTQVGHLDGYGGIATPSTDGTTIVVGAGFVHDPTVTKGAPGGTLVGVDTTGRILWTTHSQGPIEGSVAISGGVGFTPVDTNFTAIDIRTGATLWTYPAGTAAYASPAVVPSGVYFADDAGNVVAFGLGSQTSASTTRRR